MVLNMHYNVIVCYLLQTRVLVTHGIHWLPMVDTVVVMSDGVISEMGSYEELMSHEGPFAQFLKAYLTQKAETEDDEEEEEEDPESRSRSGLF